MGCAKPKEPRRTDLTHLHVDALWQLWQVSPCQIGVPTTARRGTCAEGAVKARGWIVTELGQYLLRFAARALRHASRSISVLTGAWLGPVGLFPLVGPQRHTSYCGGGGGGLGRAWLMERAKGSKAPAEGSPSTNRGSPSGGAICCGVSIWRPCAPHASGLQRFTGGTACLPACPPACPPACLPACLPAGHKRLGCITCQPEQRL